MPTRLYIDRLAHRSWIDGCIRAIPGGSQSFSYTFLRFIVRITSTKIDVHCSSLVGPWAHNLMVLGSNPIMVKVFFVHSILIDRLRDSLNIKFRKALGTAARAQISNWGSTNEHLQWANLSIYSYGQNSTYGCFFSLTFLLFWPPSKRKYDTNDISF